MDVQALFDGHRVPVLQASQLHSHRLVACGRRGGSRRAAAAKTQGGRGRERGVWNTNRLLEKQGGT
jgi:hypothetical protein